MKFSSSLDRPEGKTPLKREPRTGGRGEAHKGK